MEEGKLSELLVADQKVTQEQLAQAQQMAEATGGSIGQILVKLGFINDDVLATYLSRMEGVEQVDISSLILPENLMLSIPRECIEKHLVLPISKDHNIVTIALSNPEDFEAIEEIQFLTGMKVHTVIASKESISKAITKFFNQKDAGEVAVDDDAKVGVAADTTELQVANTEEVALSLQSPGMTDWQIQRALIPLLIQKGIITETELQEKASELMETPAS